MLPGVASYWCASKATAAADAKEPYDLVAASQLVWSADTQQYHCGARTWLPSQVFPAATERPEVTHDLTSVRRLTMPNMLHVLRARWESGLVYTRMQDMWIAVNPYRALPPATSSASPVSPPTLSHQVEPLCRQWCSAVPGALQPAVIVCGESGSGKTFSARTLLHHLMRVVSTHNATTTTVALEEGIFHGNLLLEAFGNAGTRWNHNSSRFAKCLVLAREPTLAAEVRTYLLETSRVLGPANGERNFHVLYDAAVKAATLAPMLQLPLPPTHRSFVLLPVGQGEAYSASVAGAAATETMTNSSHSSSSSWDAMWGSALQCQVFGADDAQDAKDAECKANVCSSREHDVWRVLYGALWLGEWIANPDETTNRLALQAVADTWQIPLAAVQAHLLTRTFRAGTDQVTQPLDEPQRKLQGRAVLRAAYRQCFDLLVRRLNRVTGADAIPASSRRLRLLDVFGFENMPCNSLEQLLINLTNEKLQLLFNHAVLRDQQEEYLREGLWWQPMKLPDCTEAIAAVDGPINGLLRHLETSCLLRGGTAAAFLEAAHQALKQHPALNWKRVALEKKFAVAHYAQTVWYDAAEFVAKNVDADDPATTEFLTQSQAFARTWQEPASHTNHHSVKSSNSGSSSTKVRRATTVSHGFNQDMKRLLTELGQCRCYFVRCLNPNKIKSARTCDWDGAYVKQQIGYSGLLEAQRMLSCGYPYRLPLDTVCRPYRARWPPGTCRSSHLATACLKSWASATAAASGAAAGLTWQIGLTRLFVRCDNQAGDVLLESLLNPPSALPVEFVARVQRTLVKLRWLQVLAGVRAACRLAIRVRRLRAVLVWRRAVRIAVILGRTARRSLQRARLRLHRANHGTWGKAQAGHLLSVLHRQEHELEQETQSLKCHLPAATQQASSWSQERVAAAEAVARAVQEQLVQAQTQLQQTQQTQQAAADEHVRVAQEWLARCAAQEQDSHRQVNALQTQLEEQQQAVLQLQREQQELRQARAELEAGLLRQQQQHEQREQASRLQVLLVEAQHRALWRDQEAKHQRELRTVETQLQATKTAAWAQHSAAVQAVELQALQHQVAEWQRRWERELEHMKRECANKCRTLRDVYRRRYLEAVGSRLTPSPSPSASVASSPSHTPSRPPCR